MQPQQKPGLRANCSIQIDWLRRCQRRNGGWDGTAVLCVIAGGWATGTSINAGSAGAAWSVLGDE